MKGWQRNLPLPFCLHIEASIGKPIAEKGYKMEKEYIKPEAELVKFVEEEDLMTGDTITNSGEFGTGIGGVTSWNFNELNLNAL